MAVIDNSKIPKEVVQRVKNSQIFQKIWADASKKGITYKETISAQDWFKNKAKSLGRSVKPEDLMFDEEQIRKEGIFGKMYHFFYVPKHKDNIDVLPYYDIFPLIFMVGPAPKGFYGINLHYIAPSLRAVLMDKLWEIRNNNRFSASTKLALSYQVLSSSQQYEAYRPCFKHYLNEFVYSRFLLIDSTDWVSAMFLPTERFVRNTKQGVWKESSSIIRKARKKV